ncbi:MAG: cytochrome c biogenesis protein CcdA [Parcubacteria group bacterium]
MNISIPLILGAAVVDSINPCAFGVLILLIFYLLTFRNRKTMLLIGALYVATVYAVYLLAGMGLLGFVESIGITRAIYIIAAWLAIIFGLINVKDFFVKNPKPLLAIPESRKALIEKYVHKASGPAAIILGVLVAMFELPCTGGVYLAILSLLAKQESFINALFYLLLYNLIFVLPLIIILFAAYFGLSPETLEKWRQGKRLWLRLVVGLALVLMGVGMLIL